MKFLNMMLTGFGYSRLMLDEADGAGGDLPGGEPAAPVVPAKTEPAVPAEPAKAPEGKPFEATGNQKVDYALEVIGKAGITNEHPAVAAAVETGDFGMLQHALEAAGVPGAGGLVTMLKAEYDADFAKGEEVVKGIQADVAAIAGGEEQWNAVAGFIRDNGTDEELDVLREMLGNPKMHKIAATYMTNLYNSAGGEKPVQQDVQREEYRGAPAPQRQPAEPLSRQQFAAESDKLYRKYGSEYESSQEYRALAARLR